MDNQVIPVMDNQGYAKMVTVVIQLSFGDNSKQKWLEVKKNWTIIIHENKILLRTTMTNIYFKRILYQFTYFSLSYFFF